MEPERPRDVHRGVSKVNWTTVALIGGIVILVLLVAYFARGRNADQDKLTQNELAATETQGKAPSPEKLCASNSTYDLIKRELFRRAAELRGTDQAAYDKLSSVAVVRMENPVMESEDNSTGAVNCSGSLSLDLPPGVAIVGRRPTLTADVDYTVQQAADGTGPVVLLRNADSIVTPLATLARVSETPPIATAQSETNEALPEQPEANVAASESLRAEPGPRSSYPGRPSFDCSRARTSGEIKVCSNPGLAALDLNMATQYRRAVAEASPEQRQLLETTRNRFIAYRDRCPNRSCVGEAYVGRMREIRDIIEGRWQPRR